MRQWYNEVTILANIRKGMEYREMSNSQLAELLSWPSSKISKIMSGAQKMSLNDFLEICNCLGFRYEDMIKWDFVPAVMVYWDDDTISPQANDFCNAVYRKAAEDGLIVVSKKDGSIKNEGRYDRHATFSLILRTESGARRWSFLVDEYELTPRDGMSEYAMVLDTLKEEAASAFLTDHMNPECYQYDKFTIVICNEYVFNEFVNWVGDMEFNGQMSVMLYHLGSHTIAKETLLRQKGVQGGCEE